MGRGHQMQWTKKRPSCLVFACFWKHLEMQEACTDRSPEVLSSCSSKCPVVLVLRFGLCHQLRIRQWLAKTQGCLGATHFLFKKCTLNQFGAWLWWAQQPASTNVPMTPGLNVFEAYWNVIPSGMVIFLSLHFKENGLASHPPGRVCHQRQEMLTCHCNHYPVHRHFWNRCQTNPGISEHIGEWERVRKRANRPNKSMHSFLRMFPIDMSFLQYLFLLILITVSLTIWAAERIRAWKLLWGVVVFTIQWYIDFMKQIINILKKGDCANLLWGPMQLWPINHPFFANICPNKSVTEPHESPSHAILLSSVSGVSGCFSCRSVQSQAFDFFFQVRGTVLPGIFQCCCACSQQYPGPGIWKLLQWFPHILSMATSHLNLQDGGSSQESTGPLLQTETDPFEAGLAIWKVYKREMREQKLNVHPPFSFLEILSYS